MKPLLNNLLDLHDFIGLRLMLLFKNDVERTSELVCGTFNVIEREDTIGRLKEDQFGYQSIHLLVSMPESWSKVPSLAAFARLRAEVQVRSLAQHIWAAASHYLQYKQETGVPLPVRRSIHRVSALLETVDLELDRVLEERGAYRREIAEAKVTGLLNVDLLAKVLGDIFPAANKGISEDYGNAQLDLNAFGVETVESLRELLLSVKEKTLARDAKEVQAAKKRNFIGSSKERNDRGVYFTHVGLLRQALREKFGERWDDYQKEKHETALGGIEEM